MEKDRIWTLLSRKVSGETNETELQEFEQLLIQHPGADLVVKVLTESWQARPQADQEFLEATYLLHMDRMKKKGFELSSDDKLVAETSEIEISERPRFFRPKRLAWLVPLTILIGGGAWFLFRQNKNDNSTAQQAVSSNEISTHNGSRTKTLLPDGSTVWLNAGSKLDYSKDFGLSLREVNLVGEGFFDVIKNPEKPFIVHTNSVDIKVTGTAFNVRSYPNDKTTETSLIRGSVEVTLKKRPGEKWVLKPNEKLVLLNNDATYINELSEKKEIVKIPLIAKKELTYQEGDPVAVEVAWTKNKLSFEDETFEEVARKMERWYDVSFEFRNSATKSLMLHNSFTDETLEQAMEALEFSFNFKYRIEDKKVIIY